MLRRRGKEEPNDAMAAARDAVNAGRPKDAIQLLEGVPDTSPDAAEARVLLAMAHAQAGDTERAEEILAAAIARHPDDPMALTMASLFAIGRGDLEAAVATAERAEACAGDHVAALASAASIYIAAEMPERARSAAERAIALDPDFASAHLSRGQAAEALGDLEQAVESLERAVALEPDLLPAHLSLGMLYLGEEEWDRAAHALERVVAGEKEFAVGHAALAVARAALAETRAARGSIRQAQKYGADEPDVLAMVGQAQMMLEDFAGARKTLDQAAALDPDDADIQAALVQVAALMGDESASMSALSRLLALEPEAGRELAAELGISITPARGRKRAPATAAPSAGAGRPGKGAVYQVKVTLKGSRPPIWRRLLISGDTDLGKLHRILQVAMDWGDEHLHVFRTSRGEYSDPRARVEGTRDEKRVTLADVAPAEKSKLVYEYDFGDSWEHEIVVEKVLPAQAGTQYPVCVAGKRSAPLEDSGGVWGYANLVEALSDPNHEDHEDMLEWAGEGFDPEAFDLDEVNDRLAGLR